VIGRSAMACRQLLVVMSGVAMAGGMQKGKHITRLTRLANETLMRQ
jgi:hypothetical protein